MTKPVEPLRRIDSPLPETPEGLSERAQALWRDVVADWRLEPHQLELLRLACTALDAADAAHEQVAIDGMTVAGRYGPRTHPCFAIERDSALRVARLLRALELEPTPAGRAPLELRPRRKDHR